jgi:hypothetical protein
MESARGEDGIGNRHRVSAQQESVRTSVCKEAMQEQTVAAEG